MEMDYQTARQIRKSKLSDIIVSNLIAGQSVTGSITKALSQKSIARSVGFKEKFDPLNIIKFLTGGSNLAPAILGRMLGRSKRDIQYFAGRARPVGRASTADRIRPLAGDGTSSSLDLLTNMYRFLKKSHEDEKKRYQLLFNRREEEELEKDKRHKALLKAINSSSMGVVTTDGKPKETGGFLDLINSLIKNAIDGVTASFRALLEAFESRFIKDLFFGNVKKLFPALGALLTPALAAAGVASLGGLLAYLYSKDTKPGETTAAAEGKTPSEVAQEVGPEGPGEKKYTAQQLEKVAEERQIANQVEDFKLKIRNMRLAGADDDRVKKYLRDYMTLDFANPVEKEAATRLYYQVLKEMGGGRGTVVPPMQPPETPTPAPTPTAAPVPESTATQRLDTATKENQTLNMPQKPEPSQVNTQNNLTGLNKSQSQILSKLDKLSVRNSEDTFQRMMYYSTRVV